MTRKNLLPPLLAILGGAVGFALRKWQLSAGFEPDTGLAVPGAPSALVLALWSAAMAALFLVLVQPLKSRPSETVLSTGVGNTLYIVAVLLSSVCLLVSAGAEGMDFLVSGRSAVSTADTVLTRVASMALPPLRIILCAGGLLCAGLWGRNVYTGSEKRTESLSILELCLLFCIWLISDYQIRAADPVVMDYVYEVLAIVCALLGLYYLAGCSFGGPLPRRCGFFCLLGTYFSLVTLADSHSLGDVFRYGFAVLFLAAHAVLILDTAPAGDAPAEKITESDNNG